MIGRQDEAGAAIAQLNGDPKCSKRIIVVHGLGGVGKSTFVAELRRRLSGRTAFVCIDENFGALSDGRQLVAELSRQANKAAGVPQDRFNETLTSVEDILERLIASHGGAAQRLGRLLSLGAKTAADTAAGGPVSNLATDVLEPFAIRANATWQRVRTAHRIAHAHKERQLLDDPLGLLVKAFLEDVEAWARRYAGRCVLSFDTFEVTSSEIEEFLLDRIAPDVIESEYDLRLILSGRFPLTNYNARWIDKFGHTILQLHIVPFSVEEVELYLERLVRPFAKQPVPTAAELHAATAGLPFLLERWRVDGMSAREISSARQSTFERLTSWLDEKQRSWLCKAAFPTAFDLRLLRHILGEEADAAFEFLSSDPSLCDRITGERLSLLSPIREPALDVLEQTHLLSEIAGAVVRHVAGELEHEASTALHNRTPRTARVAWLVQEWANALEVAEVADLDDDLLDTLCVLAAVVPEAIPTSSPARVIGRSAEANKADGVLHVLQSVVESNSPAGVAFLTKLYSVPDQAAGLNLLLATCSRRSGELASSLARANKAVSVLPTPRTLLECATIKMLMGRFGQALRDLDQALKMHPADSLCWATRGEIQRQQRKYADAVFSFSMAVRSGSVPDYVRAEYADALAEIGDAHSAREEAELACLMNPNDAWNQSIRAHVAARAGETEAAEEVFERAWQLAHEDYSRACIAALRGDKGVALKLLASALDQRLRTRRWARFDPDFRSLREDPEFLRLTRGK